MIDIAIIRREPDRVREIAQQKNVAIDVDQLVKLDKKRRQLQTQFDDLQRQRNEVARSITGTPTPEQLAHGRTLKEQLTQIEDKLSRVETKLQKLLWQVPNIPSADTPVGANESKNVVLRHVGKKPKLSFIPQPHWELGETLDLIDTERAAQISSSRFAYLKKELVWLQCALIQHALATLTDENKLAAIAHEAQVAVATKPFIPMIVPAMIRPDILDRMGRLEPREDRYHIQSDNLYLVGSAEHTLGPLHANQNLPEDTLPRRYVGYSTSFRREAGSHGQDVRGILRLHQFDKLEIESFTAPEASDAEQGFIVAIQEYLMQSLALPYQVVLKCTGDMGIPDYRAIDIETWLPGQSTFRETHTSDHMSDYQARRLRTKVKRKDGTVDYVHMNDATVFAIGRTLIAIMENYQQADGSIGIPDILKPYVPFEVIKKARD